MGDAASVTERTIAYMRPREQFGHPSAGFQALKHRAADLATKLAVMDEMVAHAVHRTAADEPDAALWMSLAKAEVTGPPGWGGEGGTHVVDLCARF
mgnify:CR=1 FL=1